jgi:hypothetical protein
MERAVSGIKELLCSWWELCVHIEDKAAQSGPWALNPHLGLALLFDLHISLPFLFSSSTLLFPTQRFPACNRSLFNPSCYDQKIVQKFNLNIRR